MQDQPAQSAAAVSTRISSVVVYRNGALVTRSGHGRGPVEVRGLPLLFSSETLRVKPERGAVLGLEETVRLDTVPAPLPAPEEERARILLEIARVDDELRTIALLLEVLDGMMPEAPHPQAPPPEKLVDARLFVELGDFAGAEAARLTEKRQALEKKRRELDRARARIDERARAVPAETPKVTRGARFTLDAADETPFSLEYFVSAARWVPTYALHLTTPAAQDKALAQARLVTAALVAQATGEDWSGAALAVSTADLARETTLPVLSSWRIGRAQAEAARAFRPLPNDLPALFASYDQAPRKLARSRAATNGAPPVGASTPPSATDRGRYDQGADTGEVRSFEDERTGASVATLRQREMELAASARDDDDVDVPSEAEQDAFYDEAAADGAPLEAAAAPEQPARAQQMFGARTSSSMRFVADAMAKAEPAPRNAPPPPPSAAAPMAGAAFLDAVEQQDMSKKLAKKGGMRSGAPPRAPGGRGGGGGDKSVQREEEEAELPPRFRTAYMRMAGPDEGRRGSLLPLDPMARLEWLLESADVDGAGRAELRRAIGALAQAQQRLAGAPLPRGTSALLGTHFPSVLQAGAATDIPGDGTFYRVEVREDAGPASTEHKAVPRESTDVWRTCRIDIGAASPLPPGPLTVYEDGAFKVNARLDTGAARVAGSGGVDINLGVDPDVRILARTVHVNQSEKGIVTSTSRVEHRVRIEVRNTRKQPASVVLYDRLPVPADNVKDVAVQIVDEKPPVKKTNKDAFGNELQGGFEWRVTVMPGATQNIDFTYAIDLPAKAELEGGNRRD